MKKDGFAQTVEAVAYTWFNRFAALRYMEIHDYLDHGYRVLSSREGGLPEIIAHATDVAGSLPGLNAAQIADMKLAGNQDGELYRLLLVAQCNALSKAMPFLFEHIDDESELLLPGNLERTDSVVAKLVESIAEERLERGRSHRLALPVLHFREEGCSHRQGGQERGHSCRHPALHTELDRPVPGAEQRRASLADGQPRFNAERASGSTTSNRPSRHRKSRRNSMR